MISILSVLSILPSPPAGTPSNIAFSALSFFAKWIARVGGVIAFIGLIKFCLALKEENAKEQMESVLAIISGLLIRSAVLTLTIFKTEPFDADAEFLTILGFIAGWTRKLGALGLFLGAIMLAASFRDNNANGKVNAVRTMTAGGLILCVSASIYFFA